MGKRTRRCMLSILLALSMIFSLTTPALAAGDLDADTSSVEEVSVVEDAQSGTEESGETVSEAETQDTEAAETETEATDTSADESADSLQSEEDGSVTVTASSEEDAQAEAGDEEDAEEAALEDTAEESAEETEIVTETQEVTVTPDDSDLDSLLSGLADNDELFESYVSQLFYGGCLVILIMACGCFTGMI